MMMARVAGVTVTVAGGPGLIRGPVLRLSGVHWHPDDSSPPTESESGWWPVRPGRLRPGLPPSDSDPVPLSESRFTIPEWNREQWYRIRVTVLKFSTY